MAWTSTPGASAWCLTASRATKRGAGAWSESNPDPIPEGLGSPCWVQHQERQCLDSPSTNTTPNNTTPPSPRCDHRPRGWSSSPGLLAAFESPSQMSSSKRSTASPTTKEGARPTCAPTCSRRPSGTFQTLPNRGPQPNARARLLRGPCAPSELDLARRSAILSAGVFDLLLSSSSADRVRLFRERQRQGLAGPETYCLACGRRLRPLQQGQQRKEGNGGLLCAACWRRSPEGKAADAERKRIARAKTKPGITV